MATLKLKKKTLPRYSMKLIKLALVVHINDIKYHTNFSNTNNVHRRDIKGKPLHDQEITAEEREYHKEKAQGLVRTFKAFFARQRNPPKEGSIKFRKEAHRAERDKEKNDALDIRKRKVKEISKILKQSSWVWKQFRPVPKGAEGREFIKEMHRLCCEYTDNPENTNKKIGSKTKIRRKT